MSTQQQNAAQAALAAQSMRLDPNAPAPAGATAPPADTVARLAALPTGVVAILLGSPDRRELSRVRPFSRQSTGREVPGRPHVQRQEILGGWTIDLAKVFEREETLWYALGFGTNALAINVWLGGFEREINERLGVATSAVQVDALVFPPLSPGLEQAHGRLLIGRDGRVLYEGRDNRSVFEQLQARTLYLPDVEEPAHHAPLDLVPGQVMPMQSGSALVPGASSAASNGSERSSLHVLRLSWKPFNYGGRQAKKA